MTFIASTDFTHYESGETARIKDEAAVKEIEDMDTQGLFETITEMNISMCGYAPVAIVLEACRLLGARNSRLIAYQNSGDATGDYGKVVGYGGFLID